MTTTNSTHATPWKCLALAASLAVAGCGNQQVQRVATESAARLDRELSVCGISMAGGQPPKLADDPALRGLCFEAFAVVHDAATRTPKVQGGGLSWIR